MDSKTKLPRSQHTTNTTLEVGHAQRIYLNDDILHIVYFFRFGITIVVCFVIPVMPDDVLAMPWPALSPALGSWISWALQSSPATHGCKL